MEFWLALANVYRVLVATIEHTPPMSWAPQDGNSFVRTQSKVNVPNLISLKSPEQLQRCDQVSFFYAEKFSSHNF
jgi:hypothetical protein